MSKSKETMDISKYYLPALVVIILLVVALILLPAPELSATERSKLSINELGSPIQSVKLTGLEYSFLSKVGIGSATYTVMYEDNTFIYRIVKGKLSMGYIMDYITPSVVPVGGVAGDGKVSVLLKLGGVSCSLSTSSASNQHTYSFAYDSLIQNKFFTSIKTVPCGITSTDYTFTLSGWGTKNAINVPGTYRIYVEDRVMLTSGTIVTDQNFFDMKVIGTTTPPLPPPPPTTASSIKVTSNIPSSVYIDGTGVGVSGGTFPVDAGGHDVKVVQSGYTPFMKSVTVDYGALVTVSATLNKIVVAPLPPPPPPPPVVTTVPPVVTTVPPVGTPVVTTIPGQTTPAPTSTGGMTIETEQPSGSATTTYEEESMLNSTNALIVLVLGVIAVVGYTKLYVQKGKGKRRN